MERSYEKYFRQNRLPHLWCPGCGNGIAMKAIVQAIEKRGLSQDNTVIVSGDRAEDMAVRIKYAGVAGDHISTERDYERLVQWISQQDKPVFIMPTYTAMLELREAVIRRCGGDEFWV